MEYFKYASIATIIGIGLVALCYAIVTCESTNMKKEPIKYWVHLSLAILIAANLFGLMIFGLSHAASGTQEDQTTTVVSNP